MLCAGRAHQPSPSRPVRSLPGRREALPDTPRSLAEDHRLACRLSRELTALAAIYGGELRIVCRGEAIADMDLDPAAMAEVEEAFIGAGLL